MSRPEPHSFQTHGMDNQAAFATAERSGWGRSEPGHPASGRRMRIV
jgi:hypothetical protein